MTVVVEVQEPAPKQKVHHVAVPARLAKGKKVLLKVYRHNPAQKDDPARIVTYRVPFTKGLTVLDALLWVKEHVEPGLAFRYSCRMGICGSCGMLINGKPALGCETQIADLGTDAVEVAPLTNYPVVRDVATDFTDFFSHHRKVKPYLVRQDDAIAPVRKELLQTEEEKLAYYQFTMCIMCGLCDAACPVVAMDREYLGPQALAQAYRFLADSRDQGWEERMEAVDAPHGCFRCELAGSCSTVCPKGVDPDLGTQLLKRAVLRGRLKGI
ncbi:MAG TPA: succinate dehydrogenase iron-sulfur subunit [Thermoplasmata archaeon]|nr:succinate dehydrogenase iron-sulfur subunit [Thermoplasmata archaeon]